MPPSFTHPYSARIQRRHRFENFASLSGTLKAFTVSLAQIRQDPQLTRELMRAGDGMNWRAPRLERLHTLVPKKLRTVAPRCEALQYIHGVADGYYATHLHYAPVL